MSATSQPSTDGEQPTTESKEQRLRGFLAEKATDGELYFKSKFIARIDPRTGARTPR